MRQIVLDTETTGLDFQQGHRIIEVGCVELIERKLTGRHFHVYVNPGRDVDDGAIEVHGITNEFLADKPPFATVADEFWSFIEGAELIIHNAPFDLGFMDYEFGLLNRGFKKTRDVCRITDTLAMARKKHPGQKNNLDILCKRYGVDNGHRDLHGALLDAEILADVYLAMTGGQTALSLDAGNTEEGAVSALRRVSSERKRLRVIRPSIEEQKAHQEMLAKIEKGGATPIWRGLESAPERAPERAPE
ncbi:DNA polymerase III subunit epsilon [Hydrocarboniclastica marina]|uniref:DNA polymerase III subunit epsilon n=1 Tax=Hydrocarboniclastica marina TaxID=2259620 RepID=A0A4P7XHN9_9ALTE|nr:DNA polymerase III subunit epsilon [Hydrocarboniclastica marina]QCF26183.1 DNA polymerase III subunit epsilon [Hydrocarboniclastica marina]